MTSLELTTSTFLMYFLIVLRSNMDTTLLVVFVNSLWLAQTKSTMVSNLIPLRVQFILATYILDSAMNLFEFIKLIETKTCFLKGFFIVMLNLGLSFFLFINYFLYLFDLLSWEIWKHIFNLHYFLDVSWGYLDIRPTILSVHLFDQVFSFIFVIFQHYQNLLAWLQRNRRENPRNISFLARISQLFLVT